jgi:catechol 1,2-dioxygenase
MRGRYHTDDAGAYEIHTVRPVSYPVPTDGPVGDLLRAAGRHPFRPAHIHAIVSAPGYDALTTHLFDRADEYITSDVVFAVKSSLTKEFKKNTSEADAKKWNVKSPFLTLEEDFVLVQGSGKQLM